MKRKTAVANADSMQLSSVLDSLPAVPDLYRRALTLPKMPPGVKGAPKMAMDWNQSMPGYLNTAAGAAKFGLYFPGYPFLAELAQRSEFRQPTETTAKELTRKWITFKSKGTGDKRKRIKQIEDAFKRLRVQEVFRRAAEFDGFYGIGQVFIDIKGNTEHELPLTIDEKGIEPDSLLGFQAIDPMWTTPLMWNANEPTEPTFYKPEGWMVLGRETHASRLMTFISRPVPDIIKPAYNFGGISLTQLIQPYVDRWLKTVASINRLINNFSIIFLQTDLSQVLKGGSNADLIKRVKLFIRDRDNQGLFVTDKDREMLNQLTVTLSGLSELQAQAQEHMAAPTHLPLVVLTGITPAGLNASSEGEIEVFHDWIHSVQEAFFSPHLDTVLKLVQLDLDGTIDEDIVYDYVPLKELVGEAAARVKKMGADAGVAYIQSGVITPDEERERLAHDPDSGYINLDAGEAPGPPALEGDDEGNDDEGEGGDDDD